MTDELLVIHINTWNYLTVRKRKSYINRIISGTYKFF